MKLILGDATALPLADESIDAIVCDPPYGLEFMGKAWDRYIDFERWCEEWASEALRVLKPGGHLLAFGGTRTHHRLMCGIEDAGFEIRDCLMWLYGSGFPKSLDVSKAIDKAAGAEREVTGSARGHVPTNGGTFDDDAYAWLPEYDRRDIPATDAAREWQGWGTALKPAWEPIVMARKPLRGTVAGTVLAHGTGALNIDGTRIGTDLITAHGGGVNGNRVYGGGEGIPAIAPGSNPHVGRWPANVMLDEEAAALLDLSAPVEEPSRFFYTAKASRAEREAGLEHMEQSPSEKGEMPGRVAVRRNDHPT